MEKTIGFSKKNNLNNPYILGIIKELENHEGKEYSFSDITYYANRVLRQSTKDVFGKTDIVKIANNLGFTVFRKKLNSKQEKINYMLIDDDNKELFGNEKVIILGTNIIYKLRRLIIAFDLGYYLFDYLGSEAQRKKEFYCVEYLSQNMDSIKAKNAYKFAMDILMPRELFYEEYHFTMQEVSKKYLQIEYLSNFFEVPEKCIEDRIKEMY